MITTNASAGSLDTVLSSNPKLSEPLPVPHRALVLSGGPTHPFAETTPLLESILESAGLRVDTYVDIETGLSELRHGEHGLLVAHCLRWSMKQDEKYAPLRKKWEFSLSQQGRQTIEEHLARGYGLLGLHTAAVSFDDWPQWCEALGTQWEWGVSHHPPNGPVQVKGFAQEHPVTHGISPFECEDEVYSGMRLASGATVLATAHTEVGAGASAAAVVASDHGAGRRVYLSIGHGLSAFTHTQYRQLLTQAAHWCVGRI